MRLSMEGSVLLVSILCFLSPLRSLGGFAGVACGGGKEADVTGKFSLLCAKVL